MSGYEKGVLAGMESKTVFVLYYSYLTREVHIVIYDVVGDVCVTVCVEGVA